MPLDHSSHSDLTIHAGGPTRTILSPPPPPPASLVELTRESTAPSSSASTVLTQLPPPRHGHAGGTTTGVALTLALFALLACVGYRIVLYLEAKRGVDPSRKPSRSSRMMTEAEKIAAGVRGFRTKAKQTARRAKDRAKAALRRTVDERAPRRPKGKDKRRGAEAEPLRRAMQEAADALSTESDEESEPRQRARAKRDGRRSRRRDIRDNRRDEEAAAEESDGTASDDDDDHDLGFGRRVAAAEDRESPPPAEEPLRPAMAIHMGTARRWTGATRGSAARDDDVFTTIGCAEHQTLADRLQDRQNLANFDDIEAVPELDEFGPVPVAPPPAASRREDKPTFVRLAEIRR